MHHSNRRGRGPEGGGEGDAAGRQGGAGGRRHPHASPEHQSNRSARRCCQRLHRSPEVRIRPHAGAQTAR